MMDALVKTKNVKAANAGLEILHKPARGRYGGAMFYGPPGVGKTFYTQNLGMDDDYVYIRCKYIDTPKNLLAHIVEELGEEPHGQTGKLFNTAVEQLTRQRRTLIYDEADYIVQKGFVEVIRDLNDIANAPMILVGMDKLEQTLNRYKHLYDRIRSVVRFNTFDVAEIERLAKEMCHAPLEKDAIEYIHKAGGGKFRLTIDLFDLADRIHKNSNIKIITADYLKDAHDKAKKGRRAA